jgi:hypothetical protein
LGKQHASQIDEWALWPRARRWDEPRADQLDLTALVVGHHPMECVTSRDNIFDIDSGAAFRGGSLSVVQVAPAPSEIMRRVGSVATRTTTIATTVLSA